MATVKGDRKMNPQDHDFDWVTGHLECSVDYEFAKLEHAAKDGCRKDV